MSTLPTPETAAATALQLVGVALAAVLGTDATIATLTGRETGNVVRGAPRAGHPVPVLAYEVTGAGPSEHGDGAADYDVTVDLAAIAGPTGQGGAAVANPSALVATLLGAAEAALSQPRFAAVPLDAACMRFALGSIERLEDPEGSPSDRVGGVAELTIWVTLGET